MLFSARMKRPARLSIALCVVLLLQLTESYVNLPSRKASGSFTALSSIGNFISGVIGVPPQQLIDSKTTDTLLAGTSLDSKKLICAYKASRDGWSAINFHRAVDGRGSGLVVALGRSGAVFGGFNPLGWMSTDDYGSSNSAFLWFMTGNQLVKCPVLTGGNAAVFDYAAGGPCFGAADLQLGPPRAAVMGGFAGPDMENTSVNAGSLKEGRSSVGGAYDGDKGWPARGTFLVTEVEVYCNADIVPSTGRSWLPF